MSERRFRIYKSRRWIDDSPCWVLDASNDPWHWLVRDSFEEILDALPVLEQSQKRLDFLYE